MENPARNVCFWSFQQKGSFVAKIKNAGREGQYSKMKCQCIQKTVPLGRENMHFYPVTSGREGGHAKRTPVLSPEFGAQLHQKVGFVYGEGVDIEAVFHLNR